MRNRKCFINNTVVETTFRTEEGLPFVAAPHVQLIMEGILAQAQTLFPVTICHYLLMSNHFHLIFVINNPELITSFIAYVKRESASAVNHFLGRKRHTVWCSGYDSPIILDSEKVIERIVYMYTNPGEANLVEKIEDYPNLSSWKFFKSGRGEIKRRRVPRAIIPKLPRRTLSLDEQEKLSKQLHDQAYGENTLTIEPDAWMLCFSDTAGAEPKVLNDEIERRVREKEAQYRRERERPVLGAHALRLESMRKEHQPKKFGKKMLCLGSSKEIRLPYIRWFKEYAEEGRQATQQWSVGSWLSKLPPGLFSPGGKLMANLNRSFVPLVAY